MGKNDRKDRDRFGETRLDRHAGQGGGGGVGSGVGCARMHRKGRAPRGDQRLLSSPRKIMNRGLQNQHAKGITSLYFR